MKKNWLLFLFIIIYIISPSIIANAAILGYVGGEFFITPNLLARVGGPEPSDIEIQSYAPGPISTGNAVCSGNHKVSAQNYAARASSSVNWFVAKDGSSIESGSYSGVGEDTVGFSAGASASLEISTRDGVFYRVLPQSGELFGSPGLLGFYIHGAGYAYGGLASIGNLNIDGIVKTRNHRINN